jgi:hypothetical protein
MEGAFFRSNLQQLGGITCLYNCKRGTRNDAFGGFFRIQKSDIVIYVVDILEG